MAERDYEREASRSFGLVVRELRREAGLDLAVLAERLSITPSALSSTEFGREELRLGDVWSFAEAL